MLRIVLTVILIALAAAAAYLVLWPVKIDPVAWDPGPDPGKTGPFVPNEALAAARLIPLPGPGPEDVALGPDGRLYTGLADGRIVAVPRAGGEAAEIANTGGRPLGLQFHPDGRLIVADAVKGLIAVTMDGAISVLADSVDGVPMKFVDDLDIGADGVIWFSDASQRFSYGEDANDFFEGRATGRLISHDPATGETRVRLDTLGFANGVALAPDGAYVLVNETMRYRVTRLWLSGPQAGVAEPFIENLPGFPDNISADPDGGFWIALVFPRDEGLDALAQQPFLRKVILRLAALTGPPLPDPYGWVIRADGDGAITANLQDPTGRVHTTTSVNRFGDELLVGSLTMGAIAAVPAP